MNYRYMLYDIHRDFMIEARGCISLTGYSTQSPADEKLNYLSVFAQLTILYKVKKQF